MREVLFAYLLRLNPHPAFLHRDPPQSSRGEESEAASRRLRPRPDPGGGGRRSLRPFRSARNTDGLDRGPLGGKINPSDTS